MRRALPALALILAATILSPVSRAAPTPGRTLTPVHATVIYKAAFKTKGLKGWKRFTEGSAATDSWRVNSRGILVFAGPDRGDAEVQAPVSVAGLSDFAVQAQIKVVGEPSDPVFSGFGVVARNAQPSGFRTGPTATGVMGGYYTSPGGAGLVWYPDEVGGEAATLHSGYNTFRVEVHGTDYSLIVNGKRIVAFPIPEARIGTHVGLWALSQVLQVRSFKVLRLSNATPLPSRPSIKPLALGPSDIPSGFLLAGRDDYYTIAEWARYEHVSNDEEAARGFVLGFSASYVAPTAPSTGVYAEFSQVNEFTSAQDAHAALALDFTNGETAIQSGTPPGTNFAWGDLSGVGDEARWFSYDIPEPYYGSSFPSTQFGILFRRGANEDFASGGFVAGTASHDQMLKQVLAWARIMDGRSR